MTYGRVRLDIDIYLNSQLTPIKNKHTYNGIVNRAILPKDTIVEIVSTGSRYTYITVNSNCLQTDCQDIPKDTVLNLAIEKWALRVIESRVCHCTKTDFLPMILDGTTTSECPYCGDLFIEGTIITNSLEAQRDTIDDDYEEEEEEEYDTASTVSFIPDDIDYLNQPASSTSTYRLMDRPPVEFSYEEIGGV